MGFLSGIDDVYKKYSPAWLGNKNNVWGKMLGTAESDAPQQADPNALTPEQIAAQQRQSLLDKLYQQQSLQRLAMRNQGLTAQAQVNSGSVIKPIR